MTGITLTGHRMQVGYSQIAILNQYIALVSMTVKYREQFRPWTTEDSDDYRHASVNLVYDSEARRRF